MDPSLDDLARQAESGDRSALEALLEGVQDDVHHLAMRILVNCEDARDATQDILIRIITKLPSFRHQSSFKTWVYRVAVNYLLTAKKVRDRELGLDFERFGQDLEAGLTEDRNPTVEDRSLLNEIRVSCTMALLLCLDLKHRIAYVIGDILEYDHNDGAEILGISQTNFRKRLSRARSAITAFTAQRCGIANPDAPCFCPRRLPAAIAQGHIRPDGKRYCGSEPDFERILDRVRQVEVNLVALTLQRSTPIFRYPGKLAETIGKLVGFP